MQRREEVARFQKTIEGLRQELAVKSVRAAAEINRRDGRIEELQKAYAHIDQLLQQELTQRNQLVAQITRDAEEITRLGERFVQTNQLLQKISIRLADVETSNASLTERLRKQLLEMKRLLRLLDQIDDAAGLLRQSRRWKLANPFAALLAALTGKALGGFGHLDKNVEKYRSWRSTHPEVDTLAEEIQALRSCEIPSPPATSEPKGGAKSIPADSAVPPIPATPIEFHRHDQVDVSIIIPVYNQLRFTQSCLASVQEHHDNIRFEVIVVDDCSDDATASDIR